MKNLFSLVLLISTFMSASAFANNRHCWCDLAYKYQQYYAVRDIKDYGGIHNYGALEVGANNDCSNRCEKVIRADPMMSTNYPGTTSPNTCALLGWQTANIITLMVNTHVGAGSERQGNSIVTPECGACPVIQGTFLRRSRRPNLSEQWTDGGFTYQTFTPNAPGVLASCDAALDKYECVYQQVHSGTPDVCYGMNHKDVAVQQVSTTYCPSGDSVDDDGYTAPNAIMKSGGGNTTITPAKFDSCVASQINVKLTEDKSKEKADGSFKTAIAGLKIPTLKLVVPAKSADRSIASEKAEMSAEEAVSVFKIEE